MRKKYLYLVVGLIWGVPGVIVFNKGINAYRLQPLDNIWWLLLVTVGVLIGFFSDVSQDSGQILSEDNFVA